jgi:hypothetical protein
MKTITLERQAQAIERWKSENGVVGRDYVPVNDGARRTASKRALLKALSDSAAERSAPAPFLANF